MLLAEAIDALVTTPDGVYVDGTFGRGGHSRALLERNDETMDLVTFAPDESPRSVQLYGVDPAVVAEARRVFPATRLWATRRRCTRHRHSARRAAWPRSA